MFYVDILHPANEVDSAAFEAVGITPSRFLAGFCFRPPTWFDSQTSPACPAVNMFFIVLTSAFFICPITILFGLIFDS
jgi:hypothetical protein